LSCGHRCPSTPDRSGSPRRAPRLAVRRTSIPLVSAPRSIGFHRRSICTPTGRPMNKPTLLFLAALAGYTLAACNRGTGSVIPMEDSWDKTLGFLLTVGADVTHSEVQVNSPNYSYVWNAEDLANDFRATNSQSNLGGYDVGFLDLQDGRPDPLPAGGDTP